MKSLFLVFLCVLCLFVFYVAVINLIGWLGCSTLVLLEDSSCLKGVCPSHCLQVLAQRWLFDCWGFSVDHEVTAVVISHYINAIKLIDLYYFS